MSLCHDRQFSCAIILADDELYGPTMYFCPLARSVARFPFCYMTLYAIMWNFSENFMMASLRCTGGHGSDGYMGQGGMIPWMAAGLKSRHLQLFGIPYCVCRLRLLGIRESVIHSILHGYV